eukprot:scaffold642_cov147-Skeletonema_menzelii.AAC.6
MSRVILIHHHVLYKAEELKLHAEFACTRHFPFLTIVTAYIRPLAVPQTRIHVTYKAVASRLQVQVVCAEYISVPTIVTNYNGPSASAQPRIDVATHMKVAK